MNDFAQVNLSSFEIQHSPSSLANSELHDSFFLPIFKIEFQWPFHLYLHDSTLDLILFLL